MHNPYPNVLGSFSLWSHNVHVFIDLENSTELKLVGPQRSYGTDYQRSFQVAFIGCIRKLHYFAQKTHVYIYTYFISKRWRSLLYDTHGDDFLFTQDTFESVKSIHKPCAVVGLNMLG